jgi:hypothetical protein
MPAARARIARLCAAERCHLCVIGKRAVLCLAAPVSRPARYADDNGVRRSSSDRRAHDSTSHPAKHIPASRQNTRCIRRRERAALAPRTAAADGDLAEQRARDLADRQVLTAAVMAPDGGRLELGVAILAEQRRLR